MVQDSSLGSFEGDTGVSNDSLSDISGVTTDKRRSHQRQRPVTSHETSSLYAQVDKKKKHPPSSYMSRSSTRYTGVTGVTGGHRTRSGDPVSMTTSLSGLEDLTKRKVTNRLRDSRYPSLCSFNFCDFSFFWKLSQK